MGANERSDQVTPKSTPLCEGPTVKTSLNPIPPPLFFKLTLTQTHTHTNYFFHMTLSTVEGTLGLTHVARFQGAWSCQRIIYLLE